MEGVSSVSGQSQTQGASSETQWEKELEGVGNNNNNGWRTTSTQNTQITETQSSPALDPKVQETVKNFIGTMTIEMTKQHMNPAKKISMDDDE